LSWIFPWFVLVVCIDNEGAFKPLQVHGPIDEERHAEQFVYVIHSFGTCEAVAERRWRWSKADYTVIVPGELR
jgi:hypothetical protein